MNYINILAAVKDATNAVENDAEIVPVDFVWDQISSLGWFPAVLAVSFGVVYLLYGWRIFKVLTVICFGLIGMFGGMAVGRTLDNEMWGGIIGLATLSLVSMPLMKWCICILGAVSGAVFTGGVWYAFGLPQIYLWAGAAVGGVAGGMISFIVFKAAVMLFTSMGGSAIMMSGLLALGHLYENTKQVQTTEIHDLVFECTWFLPVILLVPTVIGLYTQNKLMKKSSEWEI
ncbi:MAG: hypothetical protein FVQ79_06770 [Planctomycetes bacterium]|nr:hypothetical protein [Planctomycetota bacterium]